MNIKGIPAYIYRAPTWSRKCNRCLRRAGSIRRVARAVRIKLRAKIATTPMRTRGATRNRARTSKLTACKTRVPQGSPPALSQRTGQITRKLANVRKSSSACSGSTPPTGRFLEDGNKQEKRNSWLLPAGDTSCRHSP